MKALVHGFQCFRCHGAEGESLCRDIVSHDHGAVMLGMTHFFKCGSKGDSKFAAVIQRGEFCFGCRGQDVFNYGR